MKKILIIALAAIALNSYSSIATGSNTTTSAYSQDAVLSRGTTRLYWGNECLTLYSNGKCVLTGGDSVRIEGSYEIKDGWVILYFNGGSVSCKATIRNGSVQSVSYNGNVYRKR